LREGGAFSSRMEAKEGRMGFDFAGTYTKIVEHKRIEYAFGDRKAEIEFTPGPKGVTVRVTFDSEPTHSIEQQQGGWQAILDNFAHHVEAKSPERAVAKNTICVWYDKDAEAAARGMPDQACVMSSACGWSLPGCPWKDRGVVVVVVGPSAGGVWRSALGPTTGRSPRNQRQPQGNNATALVRCRSASRHVR